jgi:hypothetical protein
MEALTSKVQPPPDQSPAQASLNPDEAKKKQLEKEDQLSETKTEPKPEPKPDNRNNDQLEESTDSPDNTSQSVLEVQTYDNYRFWLSAGFGVIQSINPNNSQSIGYLNAGNARFGVTIAKHIYFKSSVAQDSFALEATVFGYKFIGSAADTYTVASVIPTMRYNINFGERFGIFVYGGMSQAFVISGINALQSTLTALTLPIPAFGGGVLFQIGPAWYTRLDAGYESVTLNLLLRF